MKKKEAATKNPVILGSSTTGIPEDGIVRAPESTLNGLEIDNEPAEEWDPLLDAKSSGLRLKYKYFFFVGLLAAITTSVMLWVVPVLGSNKGDHSIQISMFGDSLINHPDRDYQMCSYIAENLEDSHSSYSVDVINAGIGGNMISQMRERVLSDVIYYEEKDADYSVPPIYPPDAVIVYWDSDVADNPTNLSLSDEYKEQFTEDLLYVLEKLCNYCAYILVGGPTLMGELPRGDNPLDSAFEVYVELVRNTVNSFDCAAHNLNGKVGGTLSYMETRDLYYANLPVGWNSSYGYLTKDGEHPNSRGSALNVDYFTEILSNMTGLW